MQCVILAGGLGTRMWPRARTVPKTLLPVAGRPFADWQLGWLAAAGVTSVVYCIGFLGGQVRNHVGDGSRWGLEVRYVDEGERLRGTAGALRLAGEAGRLHDRFLVLYGDSWLQIDPADVLATSERSGLPALMSVFENHGRWDRSNAVIDGGRVVRYAKALDPIPTDMTWIDYGLSVFTRSIVERRVAGADPQDLATLQSALAHDGQLAAYVASQRFFEIGSPEGIAELEALLGGGSDEVPIRRH